MQEENLLRMSEMATPPVMETYTANILLCYLLYRIGHPIETDQLYDIAVGEDIITYFCYQESLSYLEQNRSLICEQDADGRSFYTLGKNGVACARELRNFVKKPYRDKIVMSALRYFARRKRESEVELDYRQEKHGCYVLVRCRDAQTELMELKLYAPDLTQAKCLGNRILSNPTGFYQRVIEAAFQNREEPMDVDLSDN